MELTEKQKDTILEIVQGIVAKTAKEEYSKNKKVEEKKEKDRRLRNTKLLLRNYHSFKQYAIENEDDENYVEETPIRDLIMNSQDIVASIRMTTKRTFIMIQHLDNALKALRYICEMEETDAKTSSKHYEVLSWRFIEQRAIEDIAKEYGVNERTVYKLIDAAAERLSVLLFGVYGLKVE